MIKRLLYTVLLFHIITQSIFAQTDRKSAELMNLEAALANAKARVEMNEKRITDADSIISAGKRLIEESKAELKSVDSDSRKLEKVYAAKRREAAKTAGSRDKNEANKARTELRNIDVQYKAENRALETRLREATRKQTTGITNVQKGRTARKNAADALKVSSAALKAALAKYDAAASESKNSGKNGK